MEGACPMEPFVYINTSIMSAQVVVDKERESSCKCIGQDCTLDPGACECIQKSGGNCAYKGDGCLQEVEESDVAEVLVTYPLYP